MKLKVKGSNNVDAEWELQPIAISGGLQIVIRFFQSKINELN